MSHRLKKFFLKYRLRSILKIIFFLAVAYLLIMAANILIIEMGLSYIFGFVNDQVEAQYDSRFQREDSVKILCLGDSHTFGSEAPKGQSYPDHLLALLEQNCDGKPVEMLNFGNAGFDMTRLRAILETWLTKSDQRPDVIILQGGINAYDNWDYLDRYLREKDVRLPFLQRWRGQARFLKLVDFDDVLPKEHSVPFQSFILKITANEYGRIVEIAGANNAVPIFLTYASVDGDKVKSVETGMTAVAEKMNVDVIDFVQPGTVNYFKQQGWIRPAGHPNGEGYRFMATAVYNRLVKSVKELGGCRLAPFADEFLAP